MDIQKLIAENQALKKELAEIKKTMSMCANCHCIREKDDQWAKPADYLRKKFGMNFSHGICPDCSKRLYPDL